MTELETQVVKIQLGDNRQASSFVYTLAETIEGSDTEIFVICELPMFNPAAKDECQRISEAITASLKRSYRRATKSSIFESALGTINEELSKLVTLGKNHWLGKLNAVVAIKSNNILSVSSVGKISSLLYRDGKFVSVNESSASNHPLKTFEQFSEGKLKLGDLFILSTPELLNHISIDRIKKLLDKNELPIAAQSMIEYLQEEMGPEVSCGTIFALQVEAGSLDTAEDEVDLNQYLSGPKVENVIKKPQGEWLPHNVKSGAQTALLIGKNLKNDFKNKYLKPSFWQGAVDKSSKSLNVVQSRLKKTASSFQPSQISNFSRQKKFFLISAAILLIALVANIMIARMNSTKQTQVADASDKLNKIEQLLNDSSAALVYGDEAQAQDLYNQARELFNQLPAEITDEAQKSKLASLNTQASELDKKINKVESADVESLGTLSIGNSLISLDDYVGTENDRTVIAYRKSTGKITDNTFQVTESIVDSIALQNNLAAIYNGDALYIWDVEGDIITGKYTDGVPDRDDFGGIKTYSTNNKVYFIDKSSGQVKSLSTSGRGFNGLGTAVNDDAVKSASDLAIDGNIYIASGGTILKFNSGDKQDFSPAVSGLSNSTKLYTQTDFQRLYILDSGNKKLSILNKDGSLFKNITSDKFTDPKDFSVDEKNNIIYILNGTELLKVEI
jgi:hypothetical protein